MRRLVLAAVVLFALVAPGCHRAPHARLSIAVSVFPLYDLVRRIAGPDADVSLVLPPGAAPEGWVPPGDVVARVGNAKLLVAVGLGLDPWMDALLGKAAPNAKMLRLGDRVPTLTGDDGTINAYVWMDPERARLMATAIAEELAHGDSSHALAYRERGSAVDAALAELDADVERRVVEIRKQPPILLPPRLAYYAERYGLPVRKRDSSERVDAREAFLDALGGAESRASYEELIRYDTGALEPQFR